MTAAARVSGPQVGLARGTVLVTGAEALAFPAGLITTILLTRYLPTSEYGALALGLAAIAWLEWTVVSLFSRAAYKLIAEPDADDSVAAAVVRSYVGAGLFVGALVFAGAGLAARLFGVPTLSAVLRVLAIEIPLFAGAQAYRAILVGRGMHGDRAAVAASRWTARAVLIAIGVLLRLPLAGLAGLFAAATAVELLLVRWRVGPGPRRVASGHVSFRRLLSFAAPLALSAVCMRLFDRLDLFAIRLLGSSLDTVAAYGVAQNLALAPGLLGSAFVPALIAALSYHYTAGDAEGAGRTAYGALRFGLLVLPAACLAAGAAPALIETLFGEAYRASAPLFGTLVIGAVGVLMLSMASGVLVAAGHPRWTVAVTAPMLPIAAAGHLLIIPRFGAQGAAFVTATTAFLAALTACLVAHRRLGTPLPAATLVRTLVLGIVAWVAGAWLPRPGVAGLLLICALGAALVVVVAATELTADERGRAGRSIGATLRSFRGM